MQNGFELVNPDAARAYLASLSAPVRREGEALVQRGAIHELWGGEAGRGFSGLVSDGVNYDVHLEYFDSLGKLGATWTGDCSCQAIEDCAHVAAVLLEVLGLHNTEVVRNLSAGVAPAAANRSGLSAASRNTEKPIDLPTRLQSVLGRRLTEKENGFLRRLRAVFARAQQTGQITYWDYTELGMALSQGYNWQRLEIWPQLPKTEYEFWQYVAYEAANRGVRIPEFMEAVTDPASVQEELSKWQRQREIDRWKKQLEQIAADPGITHQAPGTTDLRLLIHPTELRLEWQRPGSVDFEPAKQSPLRRFMEAYEAGDAALTQEGQWIWQALLELWQNGAAAVWDDLDESTLHALSRLARAPGLESRIVTGSGQPMARPVEPLRWSLGSAASADDDYRLTLVQANGSPLPALLAVLPGNPCLYLTPHAIFKGPLSQLPGIDALAENRIPAPALESSAGVTLLRNLQVELPERLRDRVRTLPFQVAIQCELQPIWQGSKTEDCVVTVQAEAADGYRVVWTGEDWRPNRPQRAAKGRRAQETITAYDRTALNEARALLEVLQLKTNPYNTNLATRVTKKFPETFSEWLKSVPPHVTVHLAGDLASFADPNVAGRVKLDVTEAEIDWFDLRVVLDVTDTSLSKEEVALLLKGKGQYVRLPGKGWRRLQFDITEEENERLARLGLSARELTDEPQRLHALQLADEAARKFLPAEQVERVQRRAAEIKTRVTPPLPAGVSAELRPYQLEGYHFLAYLSANHFGGILADDMGLGKTVQTLTWLMWLRQPPNSGTAAQNPAEGSSALRPALVVCPKSVMDNWRAEAARFTPGLRVRVWSAGQLENLREEAGSADLHVLNYNQLRTLSETLVAEPWHAVILDEAQYIKNPNSQTAQIARALRTEHRLVLSGTPIENRLLDLWSLMAFAMPGVLGNRAQFARLYDAKGDPFARRRLASRIRPFLLRRTKTQVAKDLPDRIEEDLFCEIEGEQKMLYQAELKRAQHLLLGIKTQKELAQQQFHFLVSLLRLRQICCHPRLHIPESTAPSAKLEALLEQLEPLMEEGQKVLVFSQFVELLNLLQPVLEKRQWPVFYLAGDTENRGELVQRFQAAEGAAIFLISLKAGGFGLNLTAASYVVLFDPWWNPAVENQAIDRTHRIGQSNKVIAYRLLIKNSIEEKIRALQKTKQSLAEDVLGEERFAQSLTMDDLRFLFAD